MGIRLKHVQPHGQPSCFTSICEGQNSAHFVQSVLGDNFTDIFCAQDKRVGRYYSLGEIETNASPVAQIAFFKIFPF